MTHLARVIRRLLERLLERWHEGPNAPRRIREEARLFRHSYPNATHAEWERFAAQLAENAYTDAFVRGFEWNERVWPGPTIDPEQVAAVHHHDASLGDGNARVRRLLTTEPRGMTVEQLRLLHELVESPYPIQIIFEEEP